MHTDTDELKKLRQALEAQALGDELISPISPMMLERGLWWQRRGQGAPWPARLLAGVLEPRRGYRFRPENVALYGLLAQQGPADTVLELGAGSGSLFLAAICAASPRRAVALELQEDAAERLERTLQAHDLRERACVLRGDLRQEALQERAREALGGGAQLVVCNPPFFPPGWGRPSAHEGVRLSTHAEHGGVVDFAQAAAALMAPQGRLWLVYDAGRLAEVVVAAQRAGLQILRVVWLPDKREGHQEEAFRVWVYMGRSGGAVTESL